MDSNQGIPGPIELFKKGWDIMRTVYWYNSVPWRLFKSVALIVFGFFCLTGSNLLHSYKPHWDWLYWGMSYGFLLIIYGPIHHVIVIPVSLKLNHYEWGRKLKLGKRIPFWTLIAFFVAGLVFGWYPLEPMTFQFQAQATRTRDISPSLTCQFERPDERKMVACQLSETRGIGKVEVHSSGHTIAVTEAPPFKPRFSVNDVREVMNQKQFQVVLYDDNDQMIRRFVRTTMMIGSN